MIATVKRFAGACAVLGVALLFGGGAQAATLLYDQDFESPAAFVNDGGDVNINNSVNDLYGDQPIGFLFAQANTVETLLITGTQAFGTGYSDPEGTGGNYALGMLSDVQNDLLALTFNVGTLKFLNFQLDVSSIDLSVFSGPFVPPGGLIPTFRFTLYDNPSGPPGLFGNGTVLDTEDGSGVLSPTRNVFDWTQLLLSLDATGNTDGFVTLQIDLLAGGYAALDNFRIAASNTEGDVGEVPEPGTLLLFGSALAGFAVLRRRRTVKA